MNYIVANIYLDKENINGRIYPTGEVQKMFDDRIVEEQLTKNMMFVEYGSGSEYGVDMTKVCGIVKDVKVVPGEHIFVDVDLIPTDALKNMSAKTKLYMSCQGYVDGNTVHDLTFIKFYFNI